VLGEGATFVVLEDEAVARARGATVIAELAGVRYGNVPVAPHTAPVARGDARSVVRSSLSAAGVSAAALAACWGAGNGDPALDDWEVALLRADLPGRADLVPPRALAGNFGQHSGVGALRAAAAALHAAGGPALAHGLARGGCRTALVLTSPERR
jgi:3-oxoacyl-(acyl-carrier-protein) synthase